MKDVVDAAGVPYCHLRGGCISGCGNQTHLLPC